VENNYSTNLGVRKSSANYKLIIFVVIGLALVAGLGYYLTTNSIRSKASLNFWQTCHTDLVCSNDADCIQRSNGTQPTSNSKDVYCLSAAMGVKKCICPEGSNYNNGAMP